MADSLSKCILNELCQKRGFGSPEYSYIKYGRDHDAFYEARVTVNGVTYNSSCAFRNIRSADNDAAEIMSSHFIAFSRMFRALILPSVPIGVMQENKKVKGSRFSLSSIFNTVPIDVMQKTKKLKGSHFSLSSNFSKGALNKTGESCLPVLAINKDTKFACFDHSVLSTTEPNTIKSTIIEPTPIKSTDTYLLRNKIRVYTGIPDKMLTQGNIAVPIGDDKWTTVNLESA